MKINTWKGVSLFLLLCVTIGVALFIVTTIYDIFGPSMTTFSFELPAKYEGGVFRSNGQEVVAELRFVTVTGEHVRVTGEIARDMVDHKITLAGNNYVRLTYKTLTEYSRRGKIQGKLHRVVSWKPLPHGEHIDINW